MTDPRRDHPAEDRLVELALGSRAADDAVTMTHLAICPSCRAAYDEIVRSMDSVLPASPAIGPPAGFEDRVLAAIGGEGTPVRRRGSRVRLAVAAAAVAGVVVGAVIGAAVRDPEQPARQAMHATALLTSSGDTVGAVLSGSHDGGELLVLRVEDGPPGKHYTCRLRLEDGSTRSAGEWDVPASGKAMWVARAPRGTTRVELVTDTGVVWSSARIRD